MAVNNSSYSSKLKYDNVVGIILSKELPRKSSGAAEMSRSALSTGQGRSTNRGSNKGRSKSRWGKSKGPREQDAECYNCEKKRHFTRNCKSSNGKSDWILDSRSVYHLCKDKEVFSTYSMQGTCMDGKQHGEQSCWQRNCLVSHGRWEGCNIATSGGILRVSNKNKEMLRGRKTRGLYRLKGSVQIVGATIKHGWSSGISKNNGQGKQQLHRCTQSSAGGYLKDPKWYKSTERCFEIYAEVWPDTNGATSAGCPEKSSKEGYKVDLEKLFS
ncbi:hypothetical protein Acr_26g0000630 [Actinidia rufa]|uniref:CCHC-type domain-containing protein n=1 Tax=Actinidia rufa TaxID=165716 RepID=A0A7J0H134_9ERIC|nr:hypothetical protein Acr_26g0000630 [Actinidia rufa]